MKLQYLKMRGFRKYKEQFEVNFEDETYIIGGNSKGKSTIAYAVTWAFLGTDLRGNDKISMINKDSNDCYVELGFMGNDNKNHVLVRYKHSTYNAKNYLGLDGLPIKQKNLEQFYIDKPLFLSIFNPDYFKDSEPAKQKELIDKYLPEIKFEDVFNKLENDEREKLDFSSYLTNSNSEIKENYSEEEKFSISKYITDNNLRIKETKNKITKIKGQVEYAKKITEEQIEQKKVFTKQEELDLLYQEKNYLEIENKSQKKENIQNNIAEKKAEEMNIQIKLDKIIDTGRKTRIEYDKILSDPLSICPCCSQPLRDNNKSIALQSKRDEMFSLGNEKSELEKKLSNIKVEVIQLKMILNSLGKATENTRLNEVTKEIECLEKEKNDIDKFNQDIEIKTNNIEKTKQDIISFVAEIESMQEKIEQYELQKIIAQKLFFMIIQEKMKFAEKFMTNTEIQFCELIKSTGEIKDCFKITRNGESFNSLSKSQKFVTILEICNMLNKISRLNIPILIDDCESYPDYNFKYDDFNTQLIIIKAKKNRLLKISNKDEYIKKVKTLKSYTKLKEYKNVA